MKSNDSKRKFSVQSLLDYEFRKLRVHLGIVGVSMDWAVVAKRIVVEAAVGILSPMIANRMIVAAVGMIAAGAAPKVVVGKIDRGVGTIPPMVAVGTFLQMVAVGKIVVVAAVGTSVATSLAEILQGIVAVAGYGFLVGFDVVVVGIGECLAVESKNHFSN